MHTPRHNNQLIQKNNFLTLLKIFRSLSCNPASMNQMFSATITNQHASPMLRSVQLIVIYVNDIEKIMRNDPLLDVSLMNDFSTKVLLRLYEPSYGIFGKPVLRKDMIGSGENYSDSNESTVQEPSLYSRLNK
mmetsp:Transcript_48081/g.56181  ORF Transcript_48081/g.56181 Transcript_48081/m.56181 type:complete len:133 (+) Transcript_48081:646-1044(+)